jgi:hypothetical protein
MQRLRTERRDDLSRLLRLRKMGVDMSRAPHDAITTALPGEVNAPKRRQIRARIRRLVEVIPPGLVVSLSVDGFEIHPRTDAEPTASGQPTDEEIEAALDTITRELRLGRHGEKITRGAFLVDTRYHR